MWAGGLLKLGVVGKGEGGSISRVLVRVGTDV